MELTKPENPNYAATVVRLQHFVNLAGCDNIQAALVFGVPVIVSKDTRPDDVGLYFPVECALEPGFLAANNLYRKPEWGNADPTKRGFFEQHGRVRAVKFRGHRSEGFWLPLSCVAAFGDVASLADGDTFDTLSDVRLCRKYIPKRNPGRARTNQPRRERLDDQLVPGQFRFHPDTENLRRNAHKLVSSDVVSVTDKWHGTSVVVGNLRAVRALRWYEKVARWVGVAVQDTEYRLTWASRKVLKGVGEPKKGAVHYYDEDLWGIVAHELEPHLPQGYTVYAEIVGWTPSGSPIQKGYAYGCAPGTHRTLVYRVTQTTPDGHVLELPWPQLKAWCAERGLEHVQELYYGTLWGLSVPLDHMSEDSTLDERRAQFLIESLEAKWVHDQPCPYNPNVPAEGVVLRVDRLHSCDALKLKAYAFLEHETMLLDKGVVDLETEQSEDGTDFPESSTV